MRKIKFNFSTNKTTSIKRKENIFASLENYKKSELPPLVDLNIFDSDFKQLKVASEAYKIIKGSKIFNHATYQLYQNNLRYVGLNSKSISMESYTNKGAREIALEGIKDTIKNIITNITNKVKGMFTKETKEDKLAKEKEEKLKKGIVSLGTLLKTITPEARKQVRDNFPYVDDIEIPKIFSSYGPMCIFKDDLNFSNMEDLIRCYYNVIEKIKKFEKEIDNIFIGPYVKKLKISEPEALKNLSLIGDYIASTKNLLYKRVKYNSSMNDEVKPIDSMVTLNDSMLILHNEEIKILDKKVDVKTYGSFERHDLHANDVEPNFKKWFTLDKFKDYESVLFSSNGYKEIIKMLDVKSGEWTKEVSDKLNTLEKNLLSSLQEAAYYWNDEDDEEGLNVEDHLKLILTYFVKVSVIYYGLIRTLNNYFVSTGVAYIHFVFLYSKILFKDILESNNIKNVDSFDEN